MVAPHVVSLINRHGEVYHLTVLRGVMLQARNGRASLRSGGQEENSVMLYIPFDVRAENAAGDAVTFLPPKEYARCADPEHHWTLQAEGESAGRCGFFVRGELLRALTLEEARAEYDDVFLIAGYYIRDYGSRPMRHYQVLSRISSRYYRQTD